MIVAWLFMFVVTSPIYPFTISKIRAEGVHFLSYAKPESKDCEKFLPLLHGIIHLVCKILQNVMVSSAEAELGLLLVNAQ